MLHSNGELMLCFELDEKIQTNTGTVLMTKSAARPSGPTERAVSGSTLSRTPTRARL